jgi:O-antigen ligase
LVISKIVNALVPKIAIKSSWSWALLIVIAASIWGSVALESLIPALALLGLMGLALFFLRPRYAYLAIAFAIPISSEVSLTGGLGTDFPSEPLMWLSFGLAVLIFFTRAAEIDLKPLLHPASLILAVIFFWTFLTSIYSTEPFVSAKYTIAKVWYMGLFYIAPLFLFRDRSFLRTWLGLLLTATILTLLIVLTRQAIAGFTFADVNKILNPFYRNHVTYACMLGVAFPFALYFRNTAKHLIIKRLLTVFSFLILFGIAFSYTRAAIIAAIVALAWLLVIRWKLTKLAIIASMIGAISIGAYFFSQDKYLEYAPDYYRTITHKNFDDLLTATYKLEDISTMERVYRWVAGYHMMLEKPIIGFGPNSFYETYKSYTVNSFQTYVSDNPEKSGIHNYYFMLLVEQGWIGLLLWSGWIIYLLILGEKLWHRLTSAEDRKLLAACLMCIVFVLVISLMNDMIETDKVGSIFFASASIITMLSIRNKLI